MKLTSKLLLVVLFASIATISNADDKRDKAIADALKALQARPGAGGADAQGKVDVVGWRDLAKLLPKELDGMKTGKIKGGTFTMGGAPAAVVPDSLSGKPEMYGIANSYSTVERKYTKTLESGQMMKLSVRVIDAGVVRAMLAPFMMAVEYDTPEGTMKSLKIEGRPAMLMQKYNDDLEITETSYMVLASERILLQFEGNEFVEPDKVAALAKSFPYDKLDKLAGVAKKTAPSKQ